MSIEAGHEYGGDVGENPVKVPEPEPQHLVVMAGLASASAAPGNAAVEGDAEEDDGGVD